MSTRCTVAHDDDFHLYQECFEQDNVYLQLDGGDWSASLDTSKIDWRDGDKSSPSLQIRMDVTMWRKIVEGWMASHWAQHPELDHRKIECDPEATLKWLSDLSKNKGEENAE